MLSPKHRTPSSGFKSAPQSASNPEARKLMPIGPRIPILRLFSFANRDGWPQNLLPSAASSENHPYFHDTRLQEPKFYHPTELLKQPSSGTDKLAAPSEEVTAKMMAARLSRTRSSEIIMGPKSVGQPAINERHAYLFSAHFGHASSVNLLAGLDRGKQKTRSGSSVSSKTSDTRSKAERHAAEASAAIALSDRHIDYGVELINNVDTGTGLEAASYGLADGIYKCIRETYKLNDPAVRWFCSTFLWEHCKKDVQFRAPHQQPDDHELWKNWTPYAFHSLDHTGVVELVIRFEVRRLDHPSKSYTLYCMMDADLPGLTSEQYPHYGYTLTLDSSTNRIREDDLLSDLLATGPLSPPIFNYPTQLDLEDTSAPVSEQHDPHALKPHIIDSLIVASPKRPRTSDDAVWEGKEAPKPGHSSGNIVHRAEFDLNLRGGQKITGHVFLMNFHPRHWRPVASDTVEHMHPYKHNEAGTPRPPSGLVARADYSGVDQKGEYPQHNFHEDSYTLFNEDNTYAWTVRLQAKRSASKEYHYADTDPRSQLDRIEALTRSVEKHTMEAIDNARKRNMFQTQIKHILNGGTQRISGFIDKDYSKAELHRINLLEEYMKQMKQSKVLKA